MKRRIRPKARILHIIEVSEIFENERNLGLFKYLQSENKNNSSNISPGGSLNILGLCGSEIELIIRGYISVIEAWFLARNFASNTSLNDTGHKPSDFPTRTDTSISKLTITPKAVAKLIYNFECSSRLYSYYS